MSKILFELTNGREGEVILRDCAFVDWWKHVFKTNYKKFNLRDNVTQTLCRQSYGQHIPPAGETEQKHIDLINLGIQEMNQLGFEWTRNYPSIGMDYSVTNDIHRGFTTLSLTQKYDRVDLTHEVKCQMMIKNYNFNIPHGREFLLQYCNKEDKLDFKLDTDISLLEYFHEKVHIINSGVHDIEDKCRSSERRFKTESQFWPECVHICFPKLDWASKNEADNRTDVTKVDYNLADLAMWTYDNDPKWNVYDLKNILGKDYLTGYFDYDDPGEWDICNHFKTTKGGFEIKPCMFDIVEHTLVPWIQSFGYPASPNIVSPIQIGRIEESWLKEFCTSKDTWQYSLEVQELQSIEFKKVDLIE